MLSDDEITSYIDDTQLSMRHNCKQFSEFIYSILLVAIDARRGRHYVICVQTINEIICHEMKICLGSYWPMK